MSIKHQCDLLGLSRSSYYHRCHQRPAHLEDELLMQAIDRTYMEEPTFGTRRMVDALGELGYNVGRERVCRLMRRHRTDISNAAPERPWQRAQDLSVSAAQARDREE